MRVDNKNFYFDIGQNNRGIYMRISEVWNLHKLKYRKIYSHYCFFFVRLKVTLGMLLPFLRNVGPDFVTYYVIIVIK
jgi:hypothetical protein